MDFSEASTNDEGMLTSTVILEQQYHHQQQGPDCDASMEKSRIENSNMNENTTKDSEEEDDDDYHDPSLSLIWPSEPLMGQCQYLGGEVAGPDDKIYCIPGHAAQVLVIDTQLDVAYPIGPKFEGKFKWLRAVRAPNGILYGLPCNATSVLRIDATNTANGDGDDHSNVHISTIPIPYHEFYTNEQERTEQINMPWKYHGGALCPIDNNIYAIPQSAHHVLQINPFTDTCTFVGPRLEGKYKWYGGIVGTIEDGAIYGIPHNSPSVLRIEPCSACALDNEGGHENKIDKNDDSTNVAVTLHGNFGTGGHKWHGAGCAPDGTIVSIPANEDSVLCIKPGSEPTLTLLGGPDVIRTGRHRSDRKYKFLGAVTGTDGMVYCLPSGSERVLQVDTIQNIVREVGPSLHETKMERIQQNKWQNGFCSTMDGCIYGIPLAADTVLKIDTNVLEENGEPTICTMKLPRACSGLAKWEGGVMASNGVMYCMPNNFKAVLRIEPSGFRGKERAGKSNSEAMRGKVKDDTNQTGSRPSDVTKTTKDEDNPQTASSSDDIPYKTGIPTLRSSAHRVRYSTKSRRNDPLPRSSGIRADSLLPASIRAEQIVAYNTAEYDLRGAVISLLRQTDPKLVGYWREDDVVVDDDDVHLIDSNGQHSHHFLERFYVPPSSLNRKDFGGCCEEAQKYLSDAIASNELFMNLFDEFVMDVVLPYFKSRLVACGIISGNSTETLSFFYQRPPTLRLQPGPSHAMVKTHRDADYGHQNGELNFWIPLTDRNRTGVDLWVESDADSGDYHPLPVSFGEMASFHGTSCRHYINGNDTACTRASLDFRVGVEGYFDPEWQMVGTKNDHNRREVRL